MPVAVAAALHPVFVLLGVQVMRSSGAPVLKFMMPPSCHLLTTCWTQPGALPRIRCSNPKGSSYVPLLVIWCARSNPSSDFSTDRRVGSRYVAPASVSLSPSDLLHVHVVVFVK